jgi:hypothetical protein
MANLSEKKAHPCLDAWVAHLCQEDGSPLPGVCLALQEDYFLRRMSHPAKNMAHLCQKDGSLLPVELVKLRS